MYKQSMMTLSALALLVSFSGASRADEYNATSDGYRSLTCAEATQKAWFVRELERTDGDTPHDAPVPSECSREIVAAASDSAEESK
jgi:hypothetical protein